MCKLYIGVRPEELPEVFPHVAEYCCAQGIRSFKIARDVGGLLRSDKFVVYLDDKEQAMSIGGELADFLDGCAAQPVPFTAPIDSDGRVSWGADPEGDVLGVGGVSWRAFVTRELASAFGSVPDGVPAGIAALFGLERLRVEGIDPTFWTPPPAWA